MELNIFAKELENALIRRGIDQKTAQKHVHDLTRSFTDEDFSEIEAISSREEVSQLADGITAILNSKKKTATPTAKNVSQSLERVEAQNPVPHQTSSERSVQPRPVTQKQVQKNAELDDGYFDQYRADDTVTVRGMTVFLVGLILTMPITLSLLGVIFGSFLAVFIGLIVTIIAGIVALVAVVAAGTGVSLIGVIFGITQLFSNAPVGIYEIGLGVTVIGIVLFVSVLIYNFSIRFVPWIINQVGVFFRFVCRKLKMLFLNVRRECCKL